jgi:hypothetical protein
LFSKTLVPKLSLRAIAGGLRATVAPADFETNGTNSIESRFAANCVSRVSGCKRGQLIGWFRDGMRELGYTEGGAATCPELGEEQTPSPTVSIWAKADVYI